MHDLPPSQLDDEALLAELHAITIQERANRRALLALNVAILVGNTAALIRTARADKLGFGWLAIVVLSVVALRIGASIRMTLRRLAARARSLARSFEARSVT